MWPTTFKPLESNTTDSGTQTIETLAPTVISASTTASAATALPGNTDGDASNADICIENLTDGWAFCNFGNSNVASATVSKGVGVPSGSFRIVRVGENDGYVSVILNTGATAGSVRFLRGAGL